MAVSPTPWSHAADRGVPVLGICGGYQMLGRTIDDEIESGVGTVPGLGLLPMTVAFGEAKVLQRTVGDWRGEPVAGYEIHHGIATVVDGVEPFLDGCRAGSVWGTMWHGAFENDGFRRAWLASASAAGARPFAPTEGALGFADRREAMIDRLADAVAEQLDTERRAGSAVGAVTVLAAGHNRRVRTLLVIGIGMGDPDQLTLQAIRALNAVDVFFVIDKGGATRELVELRSEICARHITGDYRIVEIPEVDRARASPQYREAVVDWHEQRAERFEQAMLDELAPDGCGGLLVWGDPSLYDSTIRIVESIGRRGRLDFDFRVIPGISSVQQLAAAHRIVLNGIGEPVLITTGRRLAQAVESGAENIVVMLDGELACRALIGGDWEIYWGAYLGSPDETLVSGTLADVMGEITSTRAALKERKGWIMDTYLLRRASSAAT